MCLTGQSPRLWCVFNFKTGKIVDKSEWAVCVHSYLLLVGNWRIDTLRNQWNPTTFSSHQLGRKVSFDALFNKSNTNGITRKQIDSKRNHTNMCLYICVCVCNEKMKRNKNEYRVQTFALKRLQVINYRLFYWQNVLLNFIYCRSSFVDVFYVCRWLRHAHCLVRMIKINKCAVSAIHSWESINQSAVHKSGLLIGNIIGVMCVCMCVCVLWTAQYLFDYMPK